jgi:hypothetical protein
MHRIDTPSRAIDLFGAGKPGFRDGDMAAAIAATAFNANWCNAVQEELTAIIEGAGFALSSVDLHQAYQAILQLINDHSRGFLGVRIFTASGTYVPTPGTNAAIVEVVGGGGGGGGTPATGANQGSASGGGGAGGYGKCLATTIPNSVPVTIGSGGVGGVGGNYGASGGTTSFGSLLAAYGGNGGTPGVAATVFPDFRNGGNGGAQGQVNGAIELAVGAGGPGRPSLMPNYANALAGAGGDSFFSGGPVFGDGSRGGCGGSGNSAGQNLGAHSGFAGAGGIVLIAEYQL